MGVREVSMRWGDGRWGEGSEHEVGVMEVSMRWG